MKPLVPSHLGDLMLFREQIDVSPLMFGTFVRHEIRAAESSADIRPQSCSCCFRGSGVVSHAFRNPERLDNVHLKQQ